VLAIAAIGALVIGAATRVGTPAEAAPSSLHWILPALACATVAGAVALRGRADLVTSAAILGALSLLQWVWWRRDVLDKPVLPTGAPDAVDRIVTSAVVPLAIVVFATAAATLARSMRTPAATAVATVTP
jgi:hypothetical protein